MNTIKKNLYLLSIVSTAGNINGVLNIMKKNILHIL